MNDNRPPYFWGDKVLVHKSAFPQTIHTVGQFIECEVLSTSPCGLVYVSWRFLRSPFWVPPDKVSPLAAPDANRAEDRSPSPAPRSAE